MNPALSIRIAALLLASVTLSPAAERVIVDLDFRNGSDAIKAGWIAHSDKPLKAEAGAIGTGSERAWRIRDDDGKGPEDGYYRFELSDEQREAARLKGFTFRWRLRIPDDTGATTRAISTEVCLASRKGTDVLRFGFQLGRQGNEMLASVYAGKEGVVVGGANVLDGAAFHDWTATFDPGPQLLNLTVAGRLVLSTVFTQRDRGHALAFGSRSTGIGTGDWQRVSFAIGLPEGHKMISPPKPPFQTDVLVGGKGGYHAYRIPSLVTAPNGDLLLFCEARKASLSDDGDIDLVLSRSADNGRTWSKPTVLLEEGGNAKIKFGNPTTLVDQETKSVLLAVNRDYLDDRNRRQGGSLVILRSDDNGRSWAKPLDITAQIKKPTWGHYAFGPGIGIQLRHGPHRGRLIFPANYRESFNKRQPSWSHIIYSDDHGRMWKMGGKLGDFSNECQLVETLENDRPGLLFNARNHWGRGGFPDKSGKRLVARSYDGGLTWSGEAMDPVLVEPPCQASLLRYSFAGADERSRILFTNPAGQSRARLTMRLSYDEGKTWPVRKTIHAGSAAYSCMTRMKDGSVGLIYERDNYGRLTFAAFGLAWLGEMED